jgi:HEAT repeat protein
MRSLLVLLLLLPTAGPPGFEGLDAEGWASRLATDDKAAHAAAVKRLTAGGRTSVRVLVPLLSHENDRVRRGASAALVRGGRTAEEALSALVSTCADTDPLVRRNAAAALGAIGRTAAGAGQALAKLVSDVDPDVRGAAMEALIRIGPGAAVALQAVRRALREGDQRTRGAAARAIGSFGSAAAEAEGDLLELLTHPDRDCHFRALLALTDIDARSQKFIDGLATILRESVDYGMRKAARRALQSLGPAAASAAPALLEIAAKRYPDEKSIESVVALGRAAVPVLRAALASADDRTRWTAHMVLRQLSWLSTPAVPDLVGILRGEDEDEIRIALGTLAELGEAAGSAADAVRPHLEKAGETRVLAAWAIWSITSEQAKPLAIILEALENPQLRETALGIVDSLGPDVGRFRMSLERISTTDPAISRVAARLLRRHDANDTIERSVKGLRSENSRDQCNAAKRLETLGQAALRACAALVQVAETGELTARRLALRAIGAIGPDAARLATPMLVRGLADQDSALTADLLACAGRIEARTAGLGKIVSGFCRARESLVRIEAGLALWRLTGKTETGLPAILGALGDADWKVRWHALRAIRMMGKAAEAATPRVRVIAEQDDDSEVRYWAGVTLRGIEGDRTGR